MLPPEPFVLAANDWVAVATTRTPARRAATNTERLICPDPLPSAKVGGEPPARLHRYSHYERAGRLDCPAVRTVRTTSPGTAEKRRAEAWREKPAHPRMRMRRHVGGRDEDAKERAIPSHSFEAERLRCGNGS